MPGAKGYTPVMTPALRCRARARSSSACIEMYVFLFQAEDGIRDIGVTGVQTCALPIWLRGALVSFVLLCAALIPVLFVAIWTAHADSVKDQSTMSHFLTSHMLREWSFGTLQQRMDLTSYAHFAGIGIGNVVDDVVGNRLLLLISCASALAAREKAHD